MGGAKAGRDKPKLSRESILKGWDRDRVQESSVFI